MLELKKYFICQKKITVAILIVFTFFLGSNFIKKYPVVSDNSEYLQMAINFSLNNLISNDDHQKKKLTYKIDRNPGYSILIAPLLNNDILKNNSQNCFFNQSTSNCEYEIKKIQFFNLCIFVILIIFFYLICIQFINLYLSFFATIILSSNSFFLTQISHINPEILSTLLITVISFLIIKMNKNFRLFYLYLSFIFLSFLIIIKEVFLFLPFLIMILIFVKFNFFKIKKNFFHIVILLVIAFLPYTSWMIFNDVKKKEKLNNLYTIKNNIEDSYYLKNKSIFSSKSSSVIKQRAVYSILTLDDYFALGSSFLPGNIGNKVLRNYFSKDQYLKFAKTMNGRSYYHRNSTNLFLKELSKKNIEEKRGFTVASILLIKENLPMYLLQTPLFYLRGSFAPSGRKVFYELFGKKKIYKVYLISYNLLHTLIIGGFFFFSIFLFLRKKVDFSLLIILIMPMYTLTFYSFFSHFISRYSVTIIPLCLLILFIVLSNLFLVKNEK